MRKSLVIGVGLAALCLGAGGLAIAQDQPPAEHGEDAMRVRMIDRFMTELDTNHDGSVSAEEADAGRRARLGGLDTDGNGTLSRAEFVDGMTQRLSQGLDSRFDRIDADKDGAVSPEELDRARDDRHGPMHHGHGGPGDQGDWSGDADQDK